MLTVLLLLQSGQPTAASLPYWAIVVLVGAVSGLFTLITKLQGDRVKDEVKNRERLQAKIDALHAEREEEMKRTQKLLEENISLIQSLLSK